MLYLGISEDLFDAGVALCDGERILFASNEERYTRIKNEGGFPRHALQALFAQTGVSPADIDRICYSGIMTPPLPIRLFPFLHQWAFDVRRDKRTTWFRKFLDVITYVTPLSHTSEHSRFRGLTRRLLPLAARRTLPASLRSCPIQFVDHHRAHGAVAYTLSGFDKALAITADGMGDGLSLTVTRCDGPEQRERLWSARSKDSFGLFFEVLTEAFGFIPCRDEGKLTGLAAHGDPRNVTEPLPFSMKNGCLMYTGPHGAPGVHWVRNVLLEKYSREDMAAWAQDILETIVVNVARTWLQSTGMTRLAAAGGVFANVKLNQRLHELDEVEALFICPNMGDGGLSLGAVCDQGGLTPKRIEHAFLGDAYTDAEMLDALKKAGLDVDVPVSIADACAQSIAEDKIVARFTGAMEWGPRALGNRSILARTTDRAVHDRINHLLRRSEFMPFAPAVLAEDAERYVLAIEPARHTAEFMTVCFNCTPEMQRDHAAVVHVDKTARAQLVVREANPQFHEILSAYKARTGHGILLNTSFNIHEEPIVRTPDEAVSTFLRGKLDYLALGPYWVKLPDER